MIVSTGLAQQAMLAPCNKCPSIFTVIHITMVCVCLPDGSLLLSPYDGIYGSDVRKRSYWGGDSSTAWIDYSNSLPAGLLQRFYVFAQRTYDTEIIGTAISRIQIWREIPLKSSRRAFQLVWQRRILVLPCNITHGAFHAV